MTSKKDDIELSTVIGHNSIINYKSAKGVTKTEKVSTSFVGLISQEQINLLLPKTPPQTRNQLFIHCNNIFPKYQINTPERIAMWFAQCGHECQDFTKTKEDFYYTSERLLATFPNRFTEEQAERWGGKKVGQKWIKRPDVNAIAKQMYGKRDGVTFEKDGKYYYGRGFIQLTWFENYKDFANAIKRPDILTNPDILATDFELMVICACWFFEIRNINAFADKQDVEGATRLINGGKKNLDDRQKRFARCLEVLA